MDLPRDTSSSNISNNNAANGITYPGSILNGNLSSFSQSTFQNLCSPQGIAITGSILNGDAALSAMASAQHLFALHRMSLEGSLMNRGHLACSYSCCSQASSSDSSSHLDSQPRLRLDTLFASSARQNTTQHDGQESLNRGGPILNSGSPSHGSSRSSPYDRETPKQTGKGSTCKNNRAPNRPSLRNGRRQSSIPVNPLVEITSIGFRRHIYDHDFTARPWRKPKNSKLPPLTSEQLHTLCPKLPPNFYLNHPSDEVSAAPGLLEEMFCTEPFYSEPKSAMNPIVEKEEECAATGRIKEQQEKIMDTGSATPSAAVPSLQKIDPALRRESDAMQNRIFSDMIVEQMKKCSSSWLQSTFQLPKNFLDFICRTVTSSTSRTDVGLSSISSISSDTSASSSEPPSSPTSHKKEK